MHYKVVMRIDKSKDGELWKTGKDEEFAVNEEDYFLIDVIAVAELIKSRIIYGVLQKGE